MTKPDDISRKSVRYEIHQRDKNACRKCHKPLNETDRDLDLHHIDGDHQNNSQKNLVSLCRKCHAKTNHYQFFWKRYFQEKNEKYYRGINVS